MCSISACTICSMSMRHSIISCYKEYWFDDDYDEDVDNGVILNCVNAFLRDIFPDEESVLIDISW